MSKIAFLSFVVLPLMLSGCGVKKKADVQTSPQNAPPAADGIRSSEKKLFLFRFTPEKLIPYETNRLVLTVVDPNLKPISFAGREIKVNYYMNHPMDLEEPTVKIIEDGKLEIGLGISMEGEWWVEVEIRSTGKSIDKMKFSLVTDEV